jgi:hypothetical protein
MRRLRRRARLPRVRRQPEEGDADTEPTVALGRDELAQGVSRTGSMLP